MVRIANAVIIAAAGLSLAACGEYTPAPAPCSGLTFTQDQLTQVQRGFEFELTDQQGYECELMPGGFFEVDD